MEEKKAQGSMAVLAALFANVLVAISKFVGYMLSGSAAMMNESIHSVVDCSNQILLLFGDRRAARGQSDLHQFGEGRAKYFFSTIVATMLFFGGGALGIWEAVEKLFHPSHEVSNPLIVLGILVFGILVEGSSLRVAIKEIHELNTDKLPLFRFLHESRHSEILIIFTEDFCAVIGLVLAIIGTLLTMFTGNPMFDGMMLLFASIFLAREFYSLIIGESVSKNDLEKIQNAFKRDEVKKVIDIKTVHLGPTEVMIAAKIDIADSYEGVSYDVVNKIEQMIRKALPDKKAYIYIETDEFDPNYDQKRQIQSDT